MNKFATYENEAHPANQNFWRQLPGDHPFAKHPILSRYGAELSKASFDYTKQRMGEQNFNPVMIMQTFERIMEIESQHAEQLVELAKNVTVQIWGIDRNMLDGQLTTDTGDEFGEPEAEEPEVEEVELKEEIAPELLEKEIHKRVTMNAMTHGSSVHAMLTMHHLVAQALNDISPELLQLYNQLASGTTFHYWMIDIPKIVQMMGGMIGQAAVGTVKLVKEPQKPQEQAEPQNPEPQEEKLKIEAKGWCFPVLCQELSKGVMELITLDSLTDLEGRIPRKQMKMVHDTGDRLVDEPWLIQIGPELWRRFIAVIPQGAKLAEIIAAFSALPPDQVHNIIENVVRNPQEAKTLLSALIQPEAPPPVNFEPPETFQPKQGDNTPDWQF